MSKRIKKHLSMQRRNIGKRTYYLACGSNVDGRLGIGGDSEGCQTALRRLAPITKDPYVKTGFEKEYIETEKEKSTHYTGEIPEALALSCGRAHTLCIGKSNGCIYGWGPNDKGQLGLGKDDELKSLFQPTMIDIEQYLDKEHLGIHLNDQKLNKQKDTKYFIPSPWSLLKTPIATLACGYNHSLFITSKGGQIYSCGDNKFGQLGLNDTINRHIPTHISATTDDSFFVSVAGGLSHSLALTINGEVFSFGRGAEGQLGDGISGFNPTLSKQGKSWGEDSACQLHKRSIPGRVEGELLDRPVLLIAASQGGHGSYAVTAHDGYGWRWGALDKEIPKIAFEDSFDDIKVYALDEDKNMKTEPFPLPPPLGFIAQRDRAASAPIGEIISDLNESRENEGEPPEISRRSRRSSSFDITSEFVRNAASTATATLANLSTNNESPPVSPGSSLHLFPETHANKHVQICDSNNDQYKRNTSSKDRIVALAAGARHLVCVTRSGEAYSMGSRGPYLGAGPACRLQWIHSACKLLLPGDVLINGVTCGERHTLLSSTDGRIFVCGDGRYGMLGIEGKDLELASCEDNAVPKSIPLGSDTANTNQETPGITKPKENDRVTVTTCISESSIGCSTIFHHLQKQTNSFEEKSNSESDSVLYEDDEDYWGEKGLGHELEMDFNMGHDSSQPFGKSNVEGESWKNRLSRETRRRFSSSTKAVGGVLLSTGGAVLNGVVSAVKSGIQTGESTKSYSQKIEKETKVISKSEKDVSHEAQATKQLGFNNIEHHQDSFDGLVGNAKCRVMLSAGSSHSCVFSVYDADE